jgi:hypothetical protein
MESRVFQPVQQIEGVMAKVFASAGDLGNKAIRILNNGPGFRAVTSQPDSQARQGEARQG